MTRKHFEAIAEALYERRIWCDSHEEVMINTIALDLCDVFEEMNPNFNANRFLAATRGEE